MKSPLNSLLPLPRSARLGEGAFALKTPCTVFCGADPLTAASIRRVLEDVPGACWRFSDAADHADVVFRLSMAEAGRQSYRILINRGMIEVAAHDAAGLFYAAVTLAQLARLSDNLLPGCEIADSPDFPVRGVMLDISRDKVPSMETLYWLADTLAGLKVNQLQLYTEHAFAYRGHEEVWRGASPMTGEEARLLDSYCRARHIELVPNQNSFGHLERWLALPRYNRLAELPQGGAPLPWGGKREKPDTLCPADPQSLAFLADLYDQLLPNFSSGLFNVGCDETFDLRGGGRSAELVRERGEGRVYLDFLKKIHALVTARGRRMAFWGDIIIRHPELVPELPRDAVALEWGYEEDHPFDAHGALFAASGIPFHVCPGTSSWNSLAGRTSNMLANMAAAAANGLKHGACGYLMTDWGDGGHWQPLAVSLPGFAYGAAVAWGHARNANLPLPAMLDRHLTEGFGETLLTLGDVYLFCGALHANSTELFKILSSPRSRPLGGNVTFATLRSVLERVDAAAASLPPSRSIIARETGQVIRLLRAACRRGIALKEGGIDEPSACRALARETEELMAAHAAVWRLRNREGGLQDSLARMDAILKEYKPAARGYGRK
ncbi:MAG: glycoside hydrolase family 20 zincin-like fold domain-containing protein [Kiritimatiellae bacterium]|nr:glycoside hydrolase family 20 zincin-like fold domain-containing protein [Kiritimatiellia bacterium]